MAPAGRAEVLDQQVDRVAERRSVVDQVFVAQKPEMITLLHQGHLPPFVRQDERNLAGRGGMPPNGGEKVPGGERAHPLRRRTMTVGPGIEHHRPHGSSVSDRMDIPGALIDRLAPASGRD